MSTSHYETVLRALIHLLRQVGEAFWREWMEESLTAWRRGRSVEHFLAAFGGAGSFNDLTLTAHQDHAVTPAQEPWADWMLSYLRSAAARLARHGEDVAPEELAAAFARTDDLLTGWRCFACGYGEIAPRDLEYHLASRTLRRSIPEALREGRLVEHVDDVLALRLPAAEAGRRRLLARCTEAGLPIVERDGWMRPCPRCGSEDTGRYRWHAEPGLPPAESNLPVRG